MKTATVYEIKVEICIFFTVKSADTRWIRATSTETQKRSEKERKKAHTTKTLEKYHKTSDSDS